MKNIINYCFVCVALLLLSTACQKESFIYSGPDYVEFKPTGASGTFQYYNARCYHHNYNIAPTIGANKLNLQLIGPHRSTPTTVKYEIKEFVYYDKGRNKMFGEQPEGVENTNWIKVYSTGVAGTNYDSPVTGTFQIQANSSFGEFEVNVLTNNDNTNTKNSKMIFIELVNSGDVKGNPLSNIMMLCFGKRNSSNPTIF